MSTKVFSHYHVKGVPVVHPKTLIVITSSYSKPVWFFFFCWFKKYI